MINRKLLLRQLLQDMHATRHKFLVGFHSANELVITPTQGFVLRFLAANDCVTIKAIAQALHISSSAATQLVDGLVEKSYLVRRDHPKDRRAITVCLSEKAKKMFAQFDKQCLEKMIRLFQALDDQELEQFTALNKKITNSLMQDSST